MLRALMIMCTLTCTHAFSTLAGVKRVQLVCMLMQDWRGVQSIGREARAAGPLGHHLPKVLEWGVETSAKIAVAKRKAEARAADAGE